MHTNALSHGTVLRASLLVIGLLFVAGACRSLPPGVLAPAAEATPAATAEASAVPITKTVCESGADLQVDVEFLRSMELSEDGLITVLFAADTALDEARVLAELVAEEYRPLATDLVLSLEGLRTTVDMLDRQETAGASIAAIGESIVEIGEAMDALTLQLREPCPETDA